MKRIVLLIYDAMKKHKGISCVLLVALVLISAFLSWQMTYEEDISAFLPQDKVSSKYNTVYKRLESQSQIAVLFRSKEKTGAVDDGRVVEAMDRFGELWREVDMAGLVSDLKTCVEEDEIFSVFDFMRMNVPYFLEKEDYTRMELLLADPDFIPRRIQEDKKELQRSLFSFTAQNVSSDPLHFFSPIYKKLETLKPDSDAIVEDNHLFLQGGKVGAIFFSSPFGDSESGRNAELLALADEVITKTMSEYPQLDISTIGAPVIAVSNAERIKKDSILAIVLSTVLIALVLALAFRNIGDILWVGVTIFCGSLFALGLIGLLKDSISVIALGIGSIIIGIAVNYPLHYVDYLKYEPDNRKALKDIVNPLLIGNLTTICAFLSLFLVKAEALHDFALVGALVLVGTIAFVLFFLPILMKDGKIRNKRCLKFDFGRFIPQKMTARLSLPFWCLTVVLFILSLGISFDSDMSHINYMTAQQRQDMSVLLASQQERPEYRTIYAVSEGENLQKALRANEILNETLDAGKYQVRNISVLLPSEEVQREKIQRWNRFWKSHPSLCDEIEKSGAECGFSQKAFLPFRRLIEREYQVEDPGYFDILTHNFSGSMILSAEKNPQIITYIQVPEEDADTFKTKARLQQGDSSFFFDSKDSGNQLVQLLSEEFDSIGLICSLVVFVFLWLSFGSIELSLVSFLPLAISWIWILGTMHLFGIQFNIVNIILATFIFGQGDDYTIFITEGLMHEYGTGKKILSSYKSSVILSGILMFIGIGVLVFAQHPAMKSLAQVTIIGMFTVVVMSQYLPPMAFRWLTEQKGKPRQVPLTLKRFGLSLYSILFFLVVTAVIVPATKIYFLVGADSEEKKLKYHRRLQHLSHFIANHIPGVGLSVKNRSGEDFSKPALIISNHQSHLDVMFLMMLTPKLVILTNDWVWNNIFYRTLIRKAEFYPVSDGYDKNKERLQDLVNRGYSIVVFPEGTRSADCSIQRFHRGAFALAEDLGLDILPIILHGPGHVLPKKDFMLREGHIHVEINERISLGSEMMGIELRQLTRNFRQYYIDHYNRICDEQETPSYYTGYVRMQYKYKGKDIENECRGQLFSSKVGEIAQYKYQSVLVKNSGIGAFAQLYALCHHGARVYSYEKDDEKTGILAHCAGKPKNLVILYKEEDLSDLKVDHVIDLKN